MQISFYNVILLKPGCATFQNTLACFSCSSFRARLVALITKLNDGDGYGDGHGK